MNELLLGLGGDTDYFPLSGPGPVFLESGSALYGFFGEVPDNEMPTAWNLLESVGWTENHPNYSKVTWLKFIYRHQIYFVAKTPILGPISWNELYEKGLVYSEAGYGAYNSGIEVDQYRVIDFNNYRFQIGLLKGTISDPSDAFRGNNTEWSVLINSLTTKGGRYTVAQLGGDKSSILPETTLEDTNKHFTATIETSSTANKDMQVAYWRPVLKYRYTGYPDSVGLISVEAVNVTSEQPAINLKEVELTPEFRLLRPEDVNANTNGTKPILVSDVEYDMVERVFVVTGSSELQPINLG